MAGFGGAVKLKGESEYRQALKLINQNLKEVGSALKLTASEFDKNDKSIKAVKAQKEVLNKKMQEEKEKVSTLQKEYNRMSTEYEKNGKEHDKLVKTYEQEKNKLSQIRTSLGTTSKEYQEQEKKVNSLAKEVEKSTKNQDANKMSLSKLRIELNQAKTSVNNTANEMKNLGKETKENEEHWTSWGQTIADLRTKAIEGMIKGIAKLGGMVISLGKQSIESYGEYEQLIGGVEAMFGGVDKGAEQINKVKEVAKTSWKDLTMSQNDYYKTFTSTYPLIRSSIDDENKAIETTNRMLSLESDLANTFGYDMENASNAINWALKGTFSYVDNLNIGIKGTKEGMLEAAKNCGYMVKSVDELSGDQILDILEQYADKYGALGRTALEASNTIQGSVKSMKSAWSNVLTGMADDTADFESLIQDLVTSIIGENGEGGVLNNILPRISVAIKGMGTLASELLKEIVPEIVNIIPDLITDNLPIILEAVNSTLQAIVEVLPQIITAIVDIMPQIASSIIDMLPLIIDAGVQIIQAIVQGLIDNLPTLIVTAVDLLTDFIMGFIDNIDLVIDMSLQLIEALAEGLIEALPILIEKAPIIIQKLVDAFIRNFPKIVTMAGKLIGTLATGILGNVVKLVEVAPQLIRSLVNGLVAGFTQINNVGRNIVNGLWEGISGMGGWLAGKCREFASNILGNIKGALGIHSPSTIFRDEVGKNLALGLGEGFSDEMKAVTSDMQKSIPTNFDVESNLNVKNNNSSQMTTRDMFNTFIDALKEVKIELDDEETGKFVRKTVAKAVFA